jgi:hypothetical protein
MVFLLTLFINVLILISVDLNELFIHLESFCGPKHPDELFHSTPNSKIHWGAHLPAQEQPLGHYRLSTRGTRFKKK